MAGGGSHTQPAMGDPAAVAAGGVEWARWGGVLEGRFCVQRPRRGEAWHGKARQGAAQRKDSGIWGVGCGLAGRRTGLAGRMTDLPGDQHCYASLLFHHSDWILNIESSVGFP